MQECGYCVNSLRIPWNSLGLLRLPETEKLEYGRDYDDQSYDVYDLIHFLFPSFEKLCNRRLRIRRVLEI